MVELKRQDVTMRVCPKQNVAKPDYKLWLFVDQTKRYKYLFVLDQQQNLRAVWIRKHKLWRQFRSKVLLIIQIYTYNIIFFLLVGPLWGGGVKPPETLLSKDMPRTLWNTRTFLQKNVIVIFRVGQNRSTEKCYRKFFTKYLKILILKVWRKIMSIFHFAKIHLLVYWAKILLYYC